MACSCTYSCSGGSRKITENRRAMVSERLRLQSVRFLIVRKDKQPETTEKKIIKFL